MFLRTIMTTLILTVLAVGFIYWSFPQTVEPSTQKTPVIDEVTVPAPIEPATIEPKPAEAWENNELNVETWGHNDGGDGTNLPETQIGQATENETAPQAGIKKRLNTSWNMARKVTTLAEVLLGGVLPKKTEAVPDIAVETSEAAQLSLEEIEVPNVQLPNVELPDVELPDVELPDVELPDVELPDVELLNVQLAGGEIDTTPQDGFRKRLNTTWNTASKITTLAEVLLGGLLPKTAEVAPDIAAEAPEIAELFNDVPEVAELSNDVPEPPTVQSPQQGIGKGLNKTWKTARKVTTLAEVLLGRVLPNGAQKSDESAVLVTAQPEIIGVDVSEITELSSFETDDTTASSGFNTLYHQGFVEAQNITGPIQRDKAYLRLIDFALANKKIGRTQRIVPFLSSPETRDQARRAVALAYANNNQTVAALEISDSFENKGLKAELYAQILKTDSSIEPYQVPRK